MHTLLLERDLTRHDVRELVRRGMATTHGNYLGVVRLFGMPATDYKRFLNFLTTHDCVVDFRLYRGGGAESGASRRAAAHKDQARDDAATRPRQPMNGPVGTP